MWNTVFLRELEHGIVMLSFVEITLIGAHNTIYLPVFFMVTSPISVRQSGTGELVTTETYMWIRLLRIHNRTQQTASSVHFLGTSFITQFE